MERMSLFSNCGRMILAHYASKRAHPSLLSSHKGVPKHIFPGELLPKYISVSSSYLDKGKGTGEDATLGQPIHSFRSSRDLEQAASRYDSGESYNGSASHSQDIPTDSHIDAYDHGARINLHACMQSQVPEPYGRTPTHMNMPGGVSKREVCISLYLNTIHDSVEPLAMNWLRYQEVSRLMLFNRLIELPV